MRLFLLISTFCLTNFLYSQQPVFIKDSLMNSYMESGYSNRNFKPKGKTDKIGLRQGLWKDYQVMQTMIYTTIDDVPVQLDGAYLLYGEGEYKNGQRTGLWKLYVIEDKTKKKFLHSEINYINDLMQGVIKFYFISGKLGLTGSMRNDKLNGEFKGYYETGELYVTENYSAGISTGKHTFYFKNGVVKHVLNFKNDLLEGEVSIYYPSGKLQETDTYVNNTLNGVYRYYYENGQVWIEKIFEHGKLMNVNGSFDQQGNKRDQGTLRDGNGTVIYYTEEGKIYLIVTYKDGVEVSSEEFN